MVHETVLVPEPPLLGNLYLSFDRKRLMTRQRLRGAEGAA